MLSDLLCLIRKGSHEFFILKNIRYFIDRYYMGIFPSEEVCPYVFIFNSFKKEIITAMQKTSFTQGWPIRRPCPFHTGFYISGIPPCKTTGKYPAIQYHA